MKQILTILFAVCLFASCNDGPKYNAAGVVKSGEASYDVLVIDGCEYIFRSYDRGCMFAHKGNCSNPAHKAPSTDTVVVNVTKYVLVTDSTK